MSKDTFYFSHDYHARNDEKILELRVKYGAEGYGLFWMLVETMAENDNGGAKASLIGGLSLGYGVTKERLLEFIEYCIEIELFYKEDGFVFSRRMKKHKEFRKELSKKGKEGADKRWKNSPPITVPNGDGNAKERKEKEIKDTTLHDNKTLTESNEPFQKKQIEDMVVKEMMGVWKTHNPSYYEEPELDYSACLEIAYKIAKMKKWRKEEVLNGKMQDTLMSWGKIVVFVKYDPFLKKLSISNLNSQWQNLVQKMSAKDDEGDKKVSQDKELMKKLGL